MNTEFQRAQAVFNNIYNHASDEYKSTVGWLKDGTLISDFAAPFVAVPEGNANYTPIQNEFLNILVNKIVLSIVEEKSYNGHLKALKKGWVEPLGTDIEHIYTNPINPMGYDVKNLQGILQLYDNDTKVAYYRRNREDVFPISVPRQVLMGAFTSWERFNSFVSNLVNSVFSGNEIREENLMKKAVVDATNANMLINKFIEYPTADNAKEIVTEMRTTYRRMQWASSEFNKYKEIAERNGAVDVEPVVTWTNKDRQVLLIRSDILETLGVEVLASAFNLEVADFRQNVIEVDTFDYNIYDLKTRKITGKRHSDIAFVIADLSLFQVFDNLQTTASDFIASNLCWQFFLHIWQTYGICPFANCVVYSTQSNSKVIGITTDKGVVSLTDVVQTDTVSYSFVPDVASSEVELKLISATKNGKNITDISTVLKTEIDQVAKEVTFTLGEGVEQGAYELKYTLSPTGALFPNVILSVGITKN